MDTRVDLDIIGALENADKSSCVRLSWDYLRHYEAALEGFRHLPINVLEIGVAGGPSMRIWKWFFSRAQITGIDIDPTCVVHRQDRINIEIGSQTDPEFLDRVCADRPPTVIVDDGSHIMEHMIFSFEHLFPKLLPGGVYIIEDFSFATDVRSDGGTTSTGAKPNAPRYFMDIAFYCFSSAQSSSAQNVPDQIASMVDSITFIGQALIMRKKDPLRDVPRAVATAQAYLTQHKMGAAAQEHLAAYVVRHDGPPELADRMLESVIQTGGPTVSRLTLRAENLMKMGHNDQAVRLLKQAADLPPQGHLVMAKMAHLQQSLGDIPGAIISVRAALKARPNSARYKLLLKQLEAAIVP
jgi:hypothetical protein